MFLGDQIFFENLARPPQRNVLMLNAFEKLTHTRNTQALE